MNFKYVPSTYLRGFSINGDTNGLCHVTDINVEAAFKIDGPKFKYSLRRCRIFKMTLTLTSMLRQLTASSKMLLLWADTRYLPQQRMQNNNQLSNCGISHWFCLKLNTNLYSAVLMLFMEFNLYQSMPI